MERRKLLNQEKNKSSSIIDKRKSLHKLPKSLTRERCDNVEMFYDNSKK